VNEGSRRLDEQDRLGPLADVVVIRRALSDEGLIGVANLKARGARIVWDMDDDLWNVPAHSPAHSPQFRFLTERTAVLADAAWVSTDPLADRLREEGFQGHVRVLPNLLDATAWPTRPVTSPDDPVRVAWFGSDTHQGDLDRVAQPVADALDALRGKAELTVWGDTHGELARRLWGRNCTFKDWCRIEQFPSQLVSLAPDICLCPLDRNEPFNRSKSPLKWLEASMAGAASICSDCTPFREVVRDGETGLLAADPLQWRDDIVDLVNDVAGRTALAAAARRDVLENHTWQSSPAAKSWEDAFAELKG
jgi:glycosyltransferase involved in cell wall biosynthesis